MTPAEIARAYGAEVWEFTYDNADVADKFVFSSDDWGLYQSSNLDVADTVTPALDVDGVTSLAGTITYSITLFHLDVFTTAHVSWVGTGVTLEYTLNGTTWIALSQNSVITLAGDPDFDIRVNFAGGVVDDTTSLTSLTVYILKSDTLRSNTGLRTLTLSNDPLINGTVNINTSVTIPAVASQSGVPTPVWGTVELWVTPTTTSAGTVPAGVIYKNGVAGGITAGVRQHIVAVINTAANAAITLGPNVLLDHLAVYEARLSATDVAQLYAAQTGLKITVPDSTGLTVTESTPAVQIYAYDWSVVQGSSA